MHAVIDNGTNWIAEHSDLSHDWKIRFDGDDDKATVFMTHAELIDFARRVSLAAERAAALTNGTYHGLPLA